MPVDANKKAAVSEDIGITTVKIDDNRLQVNGREGSIWDKHVY
jgi:hypothetical protein